MILSDPVDLPCGSTICNEHVKSLRPKSNIFECTTCLIGHVVPDKGFAKNSSLRVDLENENFLTQIQKLKKDSIMEMIKIQESLIDNLILKCNEFEYFNHEYFTDLECQIELRRENLKLKIDSLSEELIKIVKEKKRFFAEKGKSFQVVSQVQRDRLDLKEMFRSLNLPMQRLEEFELKQNEQLKELKLALENFQQLTLEVECITFNIDFNFDINPLNFGSFNENSQFLFRMNRESLGEIWNIYTGKRVKSLELKNDKNDEIIEYKILDKSKLLTLSNIGVLNIFDLKTSTHLRTIICQFENEERKNNSFQMKLNVNKFVSVKRNDEVLVYDLDMGRLEKNFNLKDSSLVILDIFDSQNILFRHYCHNEIRLLDFNSGNVTQTYTGHTRQITCVKLLVDKTFASGSYNEIRIWHVITGACVKIISRDFGWIEDVEFESISSQLIACCEDSTIRVWNSAYECIKVINTEVNDAVFRIKLLDDKRLLGISYDGILSVWCLKSEEMCVRCFKLNENGSFKNQIELCSF